VEHKRRSFDRPPVFFASDSVNASEPRVETVPHRDLDMVANTNKQSTEPLLVRPREAWRMLNCGNTFGYQLLDRDELESFLDGKARKITVESIHRYIARKLAAGQSKKLAAPPRRKANANVCRRPDQQFGARR
jgi:hypothetical protein